MKISEHSRKNKSSLDALPSVHFKSMYDNTGTRGRAMDMNGTVSYKYLYQTTSLQKSIAEQSKKKLRRAILQESSKTNYILRKNKQKMSHSINVKLYRKKEYLLNTINRDLDKMSQSFENFYQNQNSYDQNLISKKKKNTKLVFQKKVSIKNQLITDYPCHINEIKHQCLTGTFPLARIGGTLISNQEELYLYGGYSEKATQDPLMFHKWIDKSQTWEKIQGQNYEYNKSHKKIINVPLKGLLQIPSLSSTFHTAQYFRGFLLFIGGMSINVQKKKRYFNTDINAYHLQKKQWTKLRWNTYLRSHASTLFGNTLFIYGGIDQKQQCKNQQIVIYLNSNNIGSSYISKFSMSNTQNRFTDILGKKRDERSCMPIAHHQIVNTYEIDNYLAKQLQNNGIYMFGGQFVDGKKDNEVRKIESQSLIPLTNNQKERQNFTTNKGWEIVPIIGIRPSPRSHHTMTMLNSKCIALVVGGKDDKDEVLCDAWVLDLLHFAWIQVKLVQQDNLLKNGIYNHSAASYNSEFYIYGGVYKDQTLNSSFWTMSFHFKKINKTEKRISNKDIKKYPKKDAIITQE